MDKMEITKATKSNAKLPKIKNYKVKVNRNMVDGENRKACGFIVLVEIEGKGWFNENAVLHHYGFKTVSSTFKTYEKAKEEAESIKNKWGAMTKKDKKTEERENAVREAVKQEREAAMERAMVALIKNGKQAEEAKKLVDLMFAA